MPLVRLSQGPGRACGCDRGLAGIDGALVETPPFLNRSGQVILLVAGKEKAARVKEVMEEEPDPQRQPVQLIDPQATQVTSESAGAPANF